MKLLIKEFWIFGLKQANACVFGGFLLAIMFISKFWYPLESIHRYDFIFLSAIAFQVLLLAFKLETPREAIVIIVFHLVATAMELFKTADAIASWTYPEEFVFGIGNVPLFTGFMYSAVGSYIARVWRIFKFEYTFYPPKWTTVILVCCIYVNFFTHHFISDARWILLASTALLFWRTTIFFKVQSKFYSMPLLFGWFLVALFIWFAENIATFANIWVYPNQSTSWQLVPIAKLSSWYLLMLLSFVLISIINEMKLKKDD
jgi:uncharacterized membrane protein YoaT (DUF817 family)